MSDKLENGTARDVTVNYGTRVVSVPASVLGKLKSASKKDIIILLHLLNDPSAGREELAAASDCADSPESVDTALAFWRGAGVIGDGEPAARGVSPARRREAVAGLPNYTAEDVTKVMEGNPALGKMLDEASRILGTFFGQSESMRMVAAIDYFGIEPEYMLLVCAHCAGAGRRSVAAVMKKISDLYNSGVVTVEELEERLLVEERTGTAEQQIRGIFGMSRSRELSERERATIERWIGEFEYDIDIIRKAYNITVDTIGEPSLGYTNAILSRWFDNGLRTPEEVDAFVKKSKKEQKKTGGGKSFDSEDFFRAALTRSYGSAESAPQVPAAKSDGGRNFGKPGSGRN